MEIIEIKNKKQWNKIVSEQKYSQFLQSWEWGEFHKKMGGKVRRFAVVGDANGRECEHESTRSCGDAINPVSGTGEWENILMAAQVIKYDLPFGQSYLYCPRGPIISQKLKVESEKLWKNLFFKKIKELAKQEKNIFFRFEPICDVAETGQCAIFQTAHKIKSVQPENEWVLNLEKTEDDLLKEMQQKTRYNIRLAEKKGVEIRRANNEDDFNKFWSLISDTYNRKEIKTHSKEYYKGILESNDIVKLWLAEYQGKVVAANMISYFGDTATYMHGGANYQHRNIMAPYVLQWEVIKDVKSKGFSYYNFGGCSETNSYWQGITRFKKGFGGFEINYNGTYEIGFKRFLYKLYSFVKVLR